MYSYVYVDLFLEFCLIRKYSKYSLNLTFGWECNNTPSLRRLPTLDAKKGLIS